MTESKISLAQVKHVAGLARLGLGEQELQTMRQQLDGILDYIATLDALDVSSVEPTVTPGSLEVALRKDEVVGALSRSEVLEQAPAHAEGGFSVPKVLET